MLHGEKTHLRHLERSDIPTFVRWFNDPEVREYVAINRPMATAEEERWFERHLDDKSGEIFAIEATDGEQPVHIGNVGLHDIDWVHRHAELGIVIGEKAYWSKGYGSDAIRAVLRHAFHTLNLHRVYLRVYEDNARGIRAYEKCGFKLEGRSREVVFRHGRYYDDLRMSILDHEFAAPATDHNA